MPQESEPLSRRTRGQGRRGAQAPAAPEPAAAADDWRHHNIGRLLNASLRRFEARVLELLAAGGHERVAPSHINATRYLDTGGTRLTELAQRAAMTKQSMSELVDQLEHLGIVSRHPDPADARARIIAFTPHGRRWLEAFHRAVVQAESEMAAEIGNGLLGQLKHGLQAYCHDHDDGLTARR